MNKTTSINLGGYFFHIDEDAFNKLSNYLNAVKNSLSPEAREEIIKDIESRIAEIFQEKLGASKQVVGLNEVDAVVAIMGQPEDYKIEDEKQDTASNFTQTSNSYPTKKLYRDKENAMLGGVMSGLGHYLGVDALWLRIIMVILFFGFGTGILIYLMLWILVPEAISTTQKLEMKGQPITISNIERKVKEGFNDIKDTISNIDHQKFSQQVNQGAQKAGSTIGDIVTQIFKAIAKIIGAFIIFIGVISLIAIIISSGILFFSNFLPDTLLHDNIDTPFGFDVPFWLQGLLLIFCVGIPLFFFIHLGLKLLISNSKSLSNTVKYSLLGLWISSLIVLSIVGINFAKEFSHDAETNQTYQLDSTFRDTVKIRFVNNNLFSKDVEDKCKFKIKLDSLKKEVLYSTNVQIHLKRTEKKTPYLIIEKTSKGRTFGDASKNSENIQYNFKIVNNEIVLDNYFITDPNNKFRNQEVNIYLYLPEGTIYYPNANVEDYLGYDNDFDRNYGDEGNPYIVKNGELKCINCPDNEDNVEIETVRSEVLGNENVIKTTTLKDSLEKVTIKVNGKDVFESEVVKKRK